MSEAEDSKPEGAAFLTVQYARQKGESIVYSGVLIAGALDLFGVPRAPVIALVAALVSAGVAIYHWPYVAKDRMAFAVTPAGINIDRLGLLPWNAIADVEIVDRYVRMIRNAELRIALKRPFDTAVENAPNVGPVRRLMYRCWSIASPQEISVKLSTLDTLPETVEAAIRPHIHRNI